MEKRRSNERVNLLCSPNLFLLPSFYTQHLTSNSPFPSLISLRTLRHLPRDNPLTQDPQRRATNRATGDTRQKERHCVGGRGSRNVLGNVFGVDRTETEIRSKSERERNR
ncbi:hypothetical protein E2C01_089761 [Portunus trituberculatus]|uniref:Uncharacterized protein n=1 Tax=Portunus trituberculatus TaxID=210409 RepID=A0A5B7JJZ9_PORTR|nr:hypothetical protein [Portunus trituberculatus]